MAGLKVYFDDDGFACAATQGEAARQLGVSERTIAARLAAGCPGRRGCYRLRDLASWGRTDDDETDPAAGDSEALELLRMEKYKQAAMETMRMRGELVRVDDMHESLMSVAGLFRGAGEQLRRQFGNDALAILDEVIDEAERLIGGIGGDGDG